MSISCSVSIASTMIVLGCGVLAGGSLRAADPPADGKREQIGTVLGKAVYRDEIRTGKDVRLASELHRLFTQPVMEEYRQEHKSEVTPTQAEIDTATAYFDHKHRERIKDKEPALRDELKKVTEQLARDDLPTQKRQELEGQMRRIKAVLDPPGQFFAHFILDNWKWQRHLYDKFGGGRILWQQAGIEAFDAMHTWLETEEKKGSFKITDPALRTAFYEYWTTMKHGPFLTADKERIRAEFLEPEWARHRR
jgi:hypothetical protein